MFSESERSDLAKTLISLRRSMGLTQEQVANAIQVKRSTYAYYERTTTPPLKVLHKLANVFHVSLDVLSGRGTPYPVIQDSHAGKETVQSPWENYRRDHLPAGGELTSDEQNVLLLYRQLPEEAQKHMQKRMREEINKLDQE